MPSSSHEVPVIQVKLEPHPNADQLALIRIDDFRVVGVRKDEWQDGQLGAFIQADMVVPETSTFAWLGNQRRVRPRKFRGVMSWGLLVPAPPGAKVGDDVAQQLGVTRYEPPQPDHSTGGDSASAPLGVHAPIYDIESFYKFHQLFEPGEPVVCTEKIHGVNARFTYSEETMHVGSHRQWKTKTPNSIWWQALAKYPQIELFCRMHPGFVVYGEIFGDIKGWALKYGALDQELYFRVFDILHPNGEWEAWSDIYCCTGLPAVPVLYYGAYNKDRIMSLVSGMSMLDANTIREGLVITPMTERWSSEIGRVKLKAVSPEYLALRKGE